MSISSSLLASELENLGVSQAQASRDTHYSPSAWSNWLNGKRGVPNEVVKQIAEIYSSARLKIVHALECGCGLFKTPYLTVDKHPSTVKMAVEEELQEALEAYRKAPVKNKLRREDFTAEEWEEYLRATEQLCDIHALIEVALESGQKYYRLDVAAMERKIAAKLKERGYTKEKSRFESGTINR